MSATTCSRCAAPVDSSDAFCEQCGNNLSAQTMPRGAVTGSAQLSSSDGATAAVSAGPTLMPVAETQHGSVSAVSYPQPASGPGYAPAGYPASTPPSGYPPPASTPPPVALLPGEQVLFQQQFSPRLILTHLKDTVTVTSRRVIVQRPHTLFGFIPHGYLEQSSPNEAIAEVAAGDITSTRKIVLGSVAVILALYFFFDGPTASSNDYYGESNSGTGWDVLIGLILLVYAAWQFFSAHRLALQFRNFSGGALSAGARRRSEDVHSAKHAIVACLYGDSGVLPRADR